jgi:hypothetical protein
MADPKNARFKAPNLRTAAKRFAALRAFLGNGRPELSDPDTPHPSALDRARAAYAAETGDVDLNWLRSFADAKPRDAANFLASMVQGVAENPLAAVSPVPKGVAGIRRRGRLKAYDALRKDFDAHRMREVNQFLAQQRSPFSTGLEPPPARTTPRREYVIEQKGPRVDVFDAVDMPPEQITLEQARAMGVAGPQHPPLPSAYRFTRTGPGIDVFEP